MVFPRFLLEPVQGFIFVYILFPLFFSKIVIKFLLVCDGQNMCRQRSRHQRNGYWKPTNSNRWNCWKMKTTCHHLRLRTIWTTSIHPWPAPDPNRPRRSVTTPKLIWEVVTVLHTIVSWISSHLFFISFFARSFSCCLHSASLFATIVFIYFAQRAQNEKIRREDTVSPSCQRWLGRWAILLSRDSRSIPTSVPIIDPRRIPESRWYPPTYLVSSLFLLLLFLLLYFILLVKRILCRCCCSWLDSPMSRWIASVVRELCIVIYNKRKKMIIVIKAWRW